MRKLVLSVAAVSLLSMAAWAQNADEGLIGRARGAAHDCLAQTESNWDVTEELVETGICFVKGTLKTVNFYGRLRCCPGVKTILLASVDFDCEGNITAVNCGLSN